MVYKKIVRKVRIAKNLLLDEGSISVMIRSLEFLQKHGRTKKQVHELGQIQMHARYEEIFEANTRNTKNNWNKTLKKNSKFAWIMPPPGKGSGGHLNIFRFIDHLEKAGYENIIYMYVNGQHGSVDGVRAIMGDSYPQIKALENMQWLEPNTELHDIDGIFATSWETAYASYSLDTRAKRFYFVQDFEPYFYPVGGMYTLAENTYKMGFYGVTAGGWLKKKLATEYGMQTDNFDFGSDPDIYTYQNKDKRNEIFYYVRPFTERRGFEVGIVALDIFHKKHPEYIINLVGWDVSNYAIPFPYNNLKTLEINELDELYNRCVAGLVLSYTNMSLLPLELLRSGTIPVVNDGANNRLVSNNKYIAYAENTPRALAETLSKVVKNPNKEKYAEEASKSVEAAGWDKPGLKFVTIVEREMKRND